MLNYYVSVKRGSDATGTGTAASPWKSIAKAIGTAPSVSLGAAGARVYLEPGTYYEAVDLGLTPSATTPLEVIGDCDGAGFLAGGYADPKTGVVEWAAWDDDATVKSIPCLSHGGVRSHVTLRRIKFYGAQRSGGGCIQMASSTGWSLIDCSFIAHVGNNNAIQVTTPAAGLALVLDRCDVWSSGYGVVVSSAQIGDVDEPLLIIRNSRFRGGRNNSRALRIVQSGTAGQIIRNAVIESCSFLGLERGLELADTSTIPPTTPYQVRGCAFLHCIIGLRSGAEGIVAED